MIKDLKPSEIFVFGSNKFGFHGAGSAGYAFRGISDNTWRDDPFFINATRVYNQNRVSIKGKWAEFGKTGLMFGNQGKSYGIITTEKPGYQGIVTTNYLEKEISKLIECCKKHPYWIFLCVDFGVKRPKGYSWWSIDELKQIWSIFEIPSNLIPPKYLKLPKTTNYYDSYNSSQINI